VGLREVRSDIRAHASEENARFALRYFKTGPGEYAEGDLFLGLRAAQVWAIVRKHRDLGLASVEKLLRSKYHEDRMVALLIMVDRFRREDESVRKDIYDLYLANTRNINNWDLVDSSAPGVVGAWLFARNRRPLYGLAKSRRLWERRIAIMATLWFIRRDDFDDTLRIAKILLRDEHDLIHKAVGWMLREVGKRDRPVEEAFLKSHYTEMPRTMLRYAIERFPKSKRQAFLRGRV
jgi:3-methyladenine DNA glycosylase AlkD